MIFSVYTSLNLKSACFRNHSVFKLVLLHVLQVFYFSNFAFITDYRCACFVPFIMNHKLFLDPFIPASALIPSTHPFIPVDLPLIASIPIPILGHPLSEQLQLCASLLPLHGHVAQNSSKHHNCHVKLFCMFKACTYKEHLQGSTYNLVTGSGEFQLQVL